MDASASQPEWSQQRERMVVEQLAQRGVVAPRVLDAMRRVPREHFVPEVLRSRAYDDAALPIDCEQTISQPYMVARMTELLELAPQARVLEIGTGSGYQTAILTALAAEVFSIEWRLKLLNQAAERLEALGIRNALLRCGDGSLGWAERAPFDAILVTAGAPSVPDALLQQLADGGRLVIPTGPLGDQALLRLRRAGAELIREELLKCRFVKLLGQGGWQD